MEQKKAYSSRKSSLHTFLIDKKKKNATTNYSQLDCLAPRFQQLVYRTLCDCSVQLLKEQFVEYASWFALVGSPAP